MDFSLQSLEEKENKMDKKDIKSLSLSELKAEMELLGEKAFRAKQIFEWLHKKLIQDIDEMSNISEKLREILKETYQFTNLEIMDKITFSMVATKFNYGQLLTSLNYPGD